jgi:hypothetical protein
MNWLRRIIHAFHHDLTIRRYQRAQGKRPHDCAGL